MSGSRPFCVWTVHRECDDRRDGPITDICGTQELANSVAKGSGWYSGDAAVKKRHAITVEGNTYLLEHERPIIVALSFGDIDVARKVALREKAISKLTAEEREALGL